MALPLSPPLLPQLARPAKKLPVGNGWQTQVHGGLVGLGWSGKEADKAISEVSAEADSMSEPDVARLLRLALQTLSRA